MTTITKLSVASVLAIVCSTSAAWAAGVPVQSATEEQRGAASEAYVAGKEAFDAGNFDEALSKFRASHDVVASPNAHLMVVASLSELGRFVEAYEEVVVAIAAAAEAATADPKYEGTLASLQDTEIALRGKVGRLTINAAGASGATVTIDGKALRPDQLGVPVPVEPGSHLVEMDGAEPQTIEVAAGDTASVDLSGDNGDDGDGVTGGGSGGDWFVENRRTIAYAAGGVGVVGMVLFGAFGGLTLSKQSDLDAACGPQKLCPPESNADIDDGKTYQTVANVGLVIGVVGLAAGVGLFVWDVLDEEGSGEQAGDPSLRFVLGAGHLGLEGSF
jgi:hypothetical protein